MLHKTRKNTFFQTNPLSISTTKKSLFKEPPPPPSPKNEIRGQTPHLFSLELFFLLIKIWGAKGTFLAGWLDMQDSGIGNPQ